MVYGPGKSNVTVRIPFSSGFHLLSPQHPYEDLRVPILVAPQDEDFRFHFPLYPYGHGSTPSDWEYLGQEHVTAVICT